MVFWFISIVVLAIKRWLSKILLTPDVFELKQWLRGEASECSPLNRCFLPDTGPVFISENKHGVYCSVVCSKHRGFEGVCPGNSDLTWPAAHGQLLVLLCLLDSWAVHQPARITVTHGPLWRFLSAGPSHSSTAPSIETQVQSKSLIPDS